MIVTKRDGKQTAFNKDKIKIAVLKAFIDVDGEETSYAKDKAREIANYIESLDKDMSVEEIQNEIVNKLMFSSRKDVATKYVEYRYKRKLVRESNTTDKSILELLDGTSDYWNNENSNKNAKTATTQRDYLAGITSTDITRRFLLPKDVLKAHDDGLIHFHDADYFVQHMHNCFTGETKFVTDKGIMSFRDAHDGETVYVMAMDGQMRKATVHKYGERSFNLVNLKCGHMTHHVYCTPDHRWILKDGSVTTDLKIGDKLYALQDSSSYEIKTKEDAEAFCIGFAVGDGCDLLAGSESRSGGLRVRLCGDKTKYSVYFQIAGYSIQSLQNSSDMIAYKRYPVKQDFLNGKAWRFMSLRNKALAFHGLYAADGAKANNLLCTTDERVCLFIEETSSIAGYHISSTREDVRDTNYKKDSHLFAYHFVKHNLPNILWTVTSIEKNRRTGEAWCVEEPVTHSFTLEKGIVTGNCDLLNLEDMLQNGTVINGVMIEKPHRFITACTLATQIITAVASSQYGGVSISLSHLAPFVRDSYQRYCDKYKKWGFDSQDVEKYAHKDLIKEISDGVQTFNYQINSMSTTNGQAPFLSVFMYLGETDEFKNELAMVIEEFLNQRITSMKNEVGVYVTQAFPKLIYVLEDDNIHEGDPYYYLTELSAKCTAKRMVPDYISEKIMLQNKIDKNGEGHCYTCMGCRSFLTPYVDENGKPKYYGRFNQGVVTVNLPDIAFSSGGDFDKFWDIFEERTELCHRALQCRHERLEGTSSDVAPILWRHGALARLKKGETIDKLLHNGYSTISLGYAGLYECIKYMTGKSHTDGGAGEKFGIEVMQRLNDKCNQWKESEKIDYSLYGTPMESGTYKFARSLKKRFGDDIFIKLDGEDRDYITNSYHIPVFEKIDPFEKLAIESKFQKLSPGGAISYIECADLCQNTKAVLQVLRYIYDNIMYAELNTKSDYCHVCGYDGEIKIVDENNTLIWECPNCKNRDKDKMNVARRTCGYIGTNFWNRGRTDEIAHRYVHMDNHDIEERG